ncbi:class I adenylate-forming enzyme family protein [Mycolicibacterium hodleri]|nr:AMP-binding protein [Mycolicibacterium hodleri]
MGSPATLVDVIERGAALFDRRLAVVDDETALSYTALRTRTHEMAARLRADGVRPGDMVAVAGRNGVRWVIAAFGASMCGAVVAPLRHGLTDGEHTTALGELAPVRVLGDELSCTGAETTSPQPEHPPRDRDMALLLATSGTTGTPDYVPMTHGQLVRLYGEVGRRLGLVPEDRLLGAVPLAHSFGFNGVLLAGLLAGASVRLLPTYDRRRVAALVRDERLTVVFGPPTVFHDLGRADVVLGDSCRLAVSGSAEVSAPVLRSTCDRLGIPEVVVGYGLTEAAGTVAMGHLHPGADRIWMTPLSGVEVRIADEDGAGLGGGEAGRILVRGYNVCRRSFRDPVPDPSHWLDTGDVGRLDRTGRLIVESRRDDMVVVSGYNVYPQEVEAALMAHPSVAAAVVVGMPDPRRGQHLVAGVVTSVGHRASGDVLISHCRKLLASNKNPRTVVVLSQLPLTATGKVSRSALRRRLEQEDTNV